MTSKKKIDVCEFAVYPSMACPSILIQGPRRGCTVRWLFGVSIATATKLPLQRPPDGCVSTFHPLSRPIESYRACNHPERKRYINLVARRSSSFCKLLPEDHKELRIKKHLSIPGFLNLSLEF